ncbi:hypothetical protein N7520_003962 [Penicillium odoratum]|uniref:uncharacterized protein n=1 Tax=Penicillium odoratum TaxID=1167516 RepID=UPI002548501D|nr:uncharacterized protein N7520_003962 [Penicillium odoratum]KAJ5769403.1 hypothetical protein N7520_003962 [Penicillium odoratum]
MNVNVNFLPHPMAGPITLQLGLRQGIPNSITNLSNAAVARRIRHPKWPEYVNPLAWDQETLKALIGTVDTVENGRFDAFRHIPKREELNALKTENLGVLDALSLEVVHLIIDHMDFITLERFSRTCRYARIAANHHPTYIMMIKHCPQIRNTLAITGMGYWTSIRDFKLEMQYPYCRSCGSDGSYIYLPTCERICPNCCDLNKDYWCITIDDTKTAFAIGNEELQRVPIARVVPRTYRNTAFPMGMHYQEFMVPVKCAFEVAVKRWGTIENMQRQADAICPDFHPDATTAEMADGEIFRYFRSVQPPFGSNRSLLPFTRRPTYENFNPLVCAMASLFPYVRRPHLEPNKRYFCKGCVWACERKKMPSPDLLAYMGLPLASSNEDITTHLALSIRIPRTWPQAIIHSLGCIGCGLLMWDARATRQEKAAVLP